MGGIYARGNYGMDIVYTYYQCSYYALPVVAMYSSYMQVQGEISIGKLVGENKKGSYLVHRVVATI